MSTDTPTEASQSLQLAELILSMDMVTSKGIEARRLARAIQQGQPAPVGCTPTTSQTPSGTFALPESSPERLAIREALGCFRAAQAEGLQALLDATTDERLKDLVTRRLLYAVPALQAGLGTTLEG